MVTNLSINIAERALPKEERQMIHVLVKRMLTETNPEKLKMFTEQIRRIAAHGAGGQGRKAA